MNYQQNLLVYNVRGLTLSSGTLWAARITIDLNRSLRASPVNSSEIFANIYCEKNWKHNKYHPDKSPLPQYFQ